MDMNLGRPSFILRDRLKRLFFVQLTLKSLFFLLKILEIFDHFFGSIFLLTEFLVTIEIHIGFKYWGFGPWSDNLGQMTSRLGSLSVILFDPKFIVNCDRSFGPLFFQFDLFSFLVFLLNKKLILNRVHCLVDWYQKLTHFDSSLDSKDLQKLTSFAVGVKGVLE
jgi:hypothetical protein